MTTLRDLAAKATRGWVARIGAAASVCRPDGSYMVVGDAIYHPENVADATYIVACDPQTILALLDAGDALAEAAERCTERPGAWDSGGDAWWNAHDDLRAALAAWRERSGR